MSDKYKFVVATDEDYYPYVEFFETREQADACAKRFKKGTGSQSYPPSKPRIVVAEILSTIMLPEPEPEKK